MILSIDAKNISGNNSSALQEHVRDALACCLRRTVHSSLVRTHRVTTCVCVRNAPTALRVETVPCLNRKDDQWQIDISKSRRKMEFGMCRWIAAHYVVTTSSWLACGYSRKFWASKAVAQRCAHAKTGTSLFVSDQ